MPTQYPVLILNRRCTADRYLGKHYICIGSLPTFSISGLGIYGDTKASLIYPFSKQHNSKKSSLQLLPLFNNRILYINRI